MRSPPRYRKSPSCNNRTETGANFLKAPLWEVRNYRTGMRLLGSARKRRPVVMGQ